MEPVNHPIESATYSLAGLIDAGYRFSVPRYQRLYVWEDEQVSTLVNDLLTAAESPNRTYYLGGILVVKNPEPGLFDLIDGQQRLTTLWLMSVALGVPLADFAAIGSEPRLVFSIRETANAYFRAQLPSQEPWQGDGLHDHGLERITRAYELVKHMLSQKFSERPRPSVTKRAFCEYLRHRVEMIVTEVPQSFDLNRLFEAINNRGAQLQHHEILKSRILSHIPKTERGRYAKLWNACANMDGYIERNTSQELRTPIAPWYDKYQFTFDLRGLLNNIGKNEAGIAKQVTLNQALARKRDIFFEEHGATEFEEHPETTEDEWEDVRSILSFPQLLLHTLRIFLFDRRAEDILRINEKELLMIFEASNAIDTPKKAKDFIELLWQTRFSFDLFVIKWVKAGGEELHIVKPLYQERHGRRHKNYLRRKHPQENSGMDLLQSMLYHSQQITTHYWLTPFLLEAREHRNKEYLYDYLKRLDNLLFCTNSTDTLAARSWHAMNLKGWAAAPASTCKELDKSLGVKFPHYWFYKLDFVLWHELKDVKDDKWKSFRFTAKNSIEHVSPQTPRAEDQHTLAPDKLDDFGNLALVSRSINSEAGNKAFVIKQKEFSLKRKLDSLKSALIYSHNRWSNRLCEAHREEMKEYLNEYFTQYS